MSAAEAPDLTRAVAFWDGFPELVSDLERVSERVAAEAASAGGSVGEALLRYVRRPGKMLRPAFVIIGSWAGRRPAGAEAGTAPGTGPASEGVIAVAAAVEVLHLATLIHDDLIDGAETRRGEPSLHSLYGGRRAVLMGDYLLSRCFSIVSASTSRENALRLAAATGHLVRGEIGQLDRTEHRPFSRRAYLRRVTGKTAMLFSLSLPGGAAEAKATRRNQALLARAGYAIGVAFQIIDDVLDFVAEPTRVGKPVATDLRSGLYTLPVIEAVAAAPSVARAVQPPPSTEAAVRAAVQEITAAGGISAARRTAFLYSARARRAIARLSSGKVREILATVVDRLIERDY